MSNESPSTASDSPSLPEWLHSLFPSSSSSPLSFLSLFSISASSSADSPAVNRALKVTRNIDVDSLAGQPTPLLAIPRQLLITPERAYKCLFPSSSSPRPLGFPSCAALDDSLLLSGFLIYQIRLLSSSPSSCKFRPYLSSLPSCYSTVDWLPVAALEEFQWPRPERVKEIRRKNIEQIVREWKQLNSLIKAHRGGSASASDAENVSSCLHADSHYNSSATSDGQPALPLTISSYALPSHFSCPCGPSPFSCPVTLAEYQWAHSTVATRSCFLPDDGDDANDGKNNGENTNWNQANRRGDNSSTSNGDESGASSPSRSRSCLIPYLDLLNHSSSLVTRCALNKQTYTIQIQHKHKHISTGEQTNGKPDPDQIHTDAIINPDSPSVPIVSRSLIASHTPGRVPLTAAGQYTFNAGDEIFINYGPHTNWTLFARYGFVLAGNADEAVALTLGDVEAWLEEYREEEDKQRRIKEREYHVKRLGHSSSTAHSTSSSSSSSSISSVFLAPRRLQPSDSAILRGCGLFDLAAECPAFLERFNEHERARQGQAKEALKRRLVAQRVRGPSPAADDNANPQAEASDAKAISDFSSYRFTFTNVPQSCGPCACWSLIVFLKMRTHPALASEATRAHANTHASAASHIHAANEGAALSTSQQADLIDLLLNERFESFDHEVQYSLAVLNLLKFLLKKRYPRYYPHLASALHLDSCSSVPIAVFFTPSLLSDVLTGCSSLLPSCSLIRSYDLSQLALYGRVYEDTQRRLSQLNKSLPVSVMGGVE